MVPMASQESGVRVAANQPPPLVGHDVVTSDAALVEAVTRHASADVVDDLTALGREAGSAEAREHAMLANTHEPRAHDVRPLRQPDRRGRLPPVVALADDAGRRARAAGGSVGVATRSDHAHVRRAAGFLAWSQTEPGHGCPISMTYAAVPALRVDETLAKEWTPALAATTYDPGIRPVAEKAGALAGMGMTEKQGGSDVRANVTEARSTQVEGEYTLHGHKWFTSAPMNDVFLVLAQAPEGLSCFVVPRALPDGSRNRLDVVRLKDKLGNRSNASSEIELDGTLARRLGDEGRGVRTIIEMVAATRLDCVLGSASLMRHALAEASWHVAHRSAFGSLLADKPLMQNVVADLAVESEAATALAIRLAAAVDRIDDPHEARTAPDRVAAGEVLGLQAHAGLRGRGPGVPGRQRLRRGLRPAAPLPRGAAELRLGGLGQRQRPRRAARAGPRARGAGRVDHRGRPRPRCRRPARPGRRRHPDAARRVRGAGGRGPPPGRPDGRVPPGVAPREVRARRGGRRLLRLPARHLVRRHVRHALDVRRRAPDHRGAHNTHASDSRLSAAGSALPSPS